MPEAPQTQVSSIFECQPADGTGANEDFGLSLLGSSIAKLYQFPGGW